MSKSLAALIESLQDDPDEDAAGYAARQYGCSWPGCGQRTHSFMANDWCSYGGGDPSDGLIEGMPEDGFLCLHHKEAIEALEEGDFEQFKLLASI
jgi:hypothetical protein